MTINPGGKSSNVLTTAEQFKLPRLPAWLGRPVGPLDWPEDFEHENGRYNNLCLECMEVFVGYKRRALCRACATSGETGV